MVGGRLKPAELVDLALGFTRALLGRWRRGRALLGFCYDVLADGGAVPPDRLAKVRERPFQACVADQDVIEMHTVGLFIGEDSLTRRHQAVRFLSPIRMIRYLGDRNIEALRRALKGGVIAPVPFGRVKIVRDVFPRQEIPLVIFERPDHGRPCLGRDIPVIRERLHARHHALSCIGILVLLAGAVFTGLGIAGLLLAEPAAAQTIDRGLFADADRATRDVLAFLGDIGAGRSSVLGDMLFVFNGGVLALAGFLLVWHTVAGTLDTAREGRFGFGAWEIVRIVAAVALMAPLPGGMNGAQHAVIGLAHLGGDFANAVWEPFAQEALGEGEPIAPRPRETVWRAAIARTLILETCRYAANSSAARAGDAPYIELRESDEAYKSPGTVRVRRIGARILHYDGAGRGMPGDLCGAIRFAGLAAEGARGIAAEGHRDALAGLLPEIRAIAGDLAAHYVTGSPVYGRPLPDLDALLEGRGLAERYAGVLDTALARAASEERAELARVVAEDAKAASWMSAASFFNTIAHRTGLFQAAAHNIPGVSLPPPMPPSRV